MKVLVVDDDDGLRRSLSMILEDGGYEVVCASSGEEGLATAEKEAPRLILCDVRMPGMDGLEFLERYRTQGGEALVLVMTAYGSMELAVEAMERGAYDYLPKPFGSGEVLLTIRKAVERESLREEVDRLRREVTAERRFGRVVARSPAMVQALEVAQKVAEHPSPVLITGPTGTGKELVARLVHDESPRAEGPFVPVNCGAVPENLLESEFFGHRKGAFTGADRDRTGLFQDASGGTLFLDEVAELPPNLQVKLLRALQEGEVRPLGGGDPVPVDVRIVAATNRDLEEELQEGRLREDLYYRIAVVTLDLPPLRDRKEEIPLLVRHFLELQRERTGARVEGVEPEALEALTEYSWPGNVRELENVMERAVILSDGGPVTVESLPDSVQQGGERSRESEGLTIPDPSGDLSVKRGTAALEERLIRAALERTEGHRAKAAELLEISDRALRYKIQEYGID